MSSFKYTILFVILVANQGIAQNLSHTKVSTVATTSIPLCTSDMDCGGKASNQVCYKAKGICICKFGFLWDNDYFMCLAKTCKQTNDCQHIWSHSFCSAGVCMCDKKFYLDSASQTCKYGKSSAFVPQSVPLIVALIIVTSCLLSFVLN